MEDEKSTRDGFGAGLVEAGRDKRVVALTTDLCESTRVHLFKEAYPERFFDMGVAEQNAICVAAGLASSGKIPFVTGFAVFMAGRGYDQIRLHAGISALNIKIVGAHGGLLTGRQGASHQALEDMGMMRAIPGMTVVSPADYEEARQATIALARHNGPAYLRLGREKIPIIHGQHYKFQLGKGNIMRQGKDLAIIATGLMVNEALEAHKLLSKQGVYARVINMHTIKPFDKELIIRAAKETKGIITAEDHSIIGGLGSAVAEVLSENHPAKLVRIGVKDRFGNSGKPFELYEKYGLTAKHITDFALGLSR